MEAPVTQEEVLRGRTGTAHLLYGLMCKSNVLRLRRGEGKHLPNHLLHAAAFPLSEAAISPRWHWSRKSHIRSRQWNRQTTPYVWAWGSFGKLPSGAASDAPPGPHCWWALQGGLGSLSSPMASARAGHHLELHHHPPPETGLDP